MKEISAALVRAQKEFGPALKSAVNPAFQRNGKGGRYADLAACIDAVMEGLNNNGIALMQQTHPCEDGVIVETIFIHESGEQISGGKLHVPASKHDAQGYGSALTYARRYSLQAACGIAPEDDDGQAASKPRAEPAKPEPKPEPKPEAPKSTKTQTTAGKPGPWQITLHEREDGDWATAILDATDIALQVAASSEDVQNIFKANRVHYDRLKEETPTIYDDLLAMLKKAKLSFTQD